MCVKENCFGTVDEMGNDHPQPIKETAYNSTVVVGFVTDHPDTITKRTWIIGAAA